MIEWTVTWLKAARAPFLVVSFVPACLGGAVAYAHGRFDWLLFALAAFGVVMAQSAADFIDDYFDYRSGNLGNKDVQFHDSPVLQGKITVSQVLAAGLVCLAVALAAGVFFLVRVGMPVLWLGLAGTAIVVFYTAPPFKLNYRGFGEFALFLGFGPLLVLGVYTAVAGRLHWEALLASLPVGLQVMNVGLVSHTFDYGSDVDSKKMSLVVRFGQDNAVRLLAATTALGYVVVAAAAAFGAMPPWTLAAFLGAPLAVSTVKAARRYREKAGYLPAMQRAVGLATLTGVLLTVAYLL